MIFHRPFIHCLIVPNDTVRQAVNNLDSSVVVQELELAMNLALYGLW